MANAQPPTMPGMPPEAIPRAQPPKDEKRGLFHHEEKPTGQLTDLSSQVTMVSRQLRVLEERYTNLRKKTQVTDQNMLSAHKETNLEIRTLKSEMDEFKKELEDIKSKLRLIVQELKACAKTEDVKVLQKYIEMWNPVEFITKKEVENMIRTFLSEKPE